MAVWDMLANLFGIGHHDETDGSAVRHQNAWSERRMRLLSRRCGGLACSDHDTSLKAEPKVAKDQSDQEDDYQPRPRRQKRGETRRNSETKFDAIDKDVDDVNKPQDKTFDDTHTPLKASFVAATTHSPIVKTSSDTALHAAKPHQLSYPLDLEHGDEDEAFHDSYDFSAFDAKASLEKLLNDVLARHQPKRAFGMGLVGELLSRKFKKDLTHSQKNAIYSFNDHRPYFTYWVTTVQILIMIITLITYGFGPFGPSKSIINATVHVSSLTWHREAYYEQENIWYGPRSADLIHLGAKFTPCMRKDSLIYREILKDREDERSTGCCIRKDDPYCLQATKDACPPLFVWHSWSDQTSSAFNSSLKRRTSGPVCGQDPQYCLTPASTNPHEWPDDITQWPICRERLKTTRKSHHMSCIVAGRPCCIGIYGQCRITTDEHCRFLRGTYHPEATLCSQISCMEDVCGMVPFYARDYPDQFYRLFTSLFLHAGLIHLTFTIILQYYIMRDIERLLGSTRTAIIYILPGVAGNIASATFVPYNSQVGPSGSQFALLACLMAEIINSWHLLEDAGAALQRLVSTAIGLFVLGLLPWIDNYAHIFGFLLGFLLSLALTPYLTPFNDAYSKRKKVIQIWVCISLVVMTVVLLLIPLYMFPLYKCSWCQYLDCWPLTPDWCENQDIKVSRLDIF